MTSAINDRLSRAVRPGYGMKSPVAAASTGNIVLYGSTQTIDGVACSTGRILVWQQTNAFENGVYDVSGSTWARAKDFDGSGDVVRGSFVPVRPGGTAYGSKLGQVISTGQNFDGAHLIGNSSDYDNINFSLLSYSTDVTNPLLISAGGTSSTSASGARAALGVPGVPVTLADGGTSSTSASGARTALGVAYEEADSIIATSVFL